MAASYATRDDVYRLAPAGALKLPARQIASVDASTDRLELDGHGFAEGTPVQFRAEAAGVLPSPLAEGTVYYAKPVTDSDSLFQVSTTNGGVAVNLTNTGTAPFSVFRSVGEKLDELLEHHSRWIDSTLASHGVPFDAPVPAFIRNAVCLFTLVSFARLEGLGGFGDLVTEAEAIRADILRMGKSGITLRDSDATASTNKAIARSYSASTTSTTRTLP